MTTKKLSRSMEAMLLAYADGELDELAAERVRRWLAKDPEAAAALARFQADLQAVREGLGEPAPSPWPGLVYPARPKRLRYAMAAATLAVALSAWLWWPPTPPEEHAAAPADELATLRAEVETLTAQVAQFEQKLDAIEPDPVTAALLDAGREETAAIVVAAGMRLEESVGDAAGAEERYRYVLKAYPDSRAAEKARERLKRLKGTEL